MAEAVKYRVFKRVDAVLDERVFDAVDVELMTPWLLGGFPDVVPMTQWEWLKSITNSRRRKILTRAAARLNERGEYHAEFKIVKPFVKTENLPWFGINDGVPDVSACEYVARLIQAPHDETHIVAGPWLKRCTAALKEHWNADNWIFYASVSPEKLDGWLRKHQHAQSFFWSDYSAFDATWTARAWATIERFYRMVMPDAPPEFWEVLAIWRKPRGEATFRSEGAKVCYQADTMMLSGRDDTALANALLNGMAIAFSFASALTGVPVHQVGAAELHIASQCVSIAIVGDDSLVCCDFDVEPLLPRVLAGIRAFGLVVKAGFSRDLCDVTFLGCMPYATSEGLFWGPTIGRRLYKAFWQQEPVGHLPAWVHGVAQQMALVACVPVLHELGVRVCELLKGQAVLRQEDTYKHSRAAMTPHWDDVTVEWLSRRYGGLVTSAMVQRDVARVRDIRRLPCVIHSEVFQVCVCRDEL